MGGLGFLTSMGVTRAGVECAGVGFGDATYTVGTVGVVGTAAVGTVGVAMVPDVDVTSSVLNGVWSQMLCHGTCDVELASEHVCHSLMMMKAWVIRGVMTEVPATTAFLCAACSEY